MPRRLRPEVDFHQPRFMQISESHCGPAVIQMLLSNVGVEVTQEAIAEAGEASRLIELNGMRVDQLALAVRKLAPQVVFFYKDHASINELVQIVNDYRYPAGVEWQGVFEDEPEMALDESRPNKKADSFPDSESEDEDYGHYSLVVGADRRKRLLIIADPYKDYYSQARFFSFEAFDARWYDYNEVPDAVTGESVLIKDDHLVFVIVRRNILFPHRLGMRSFSTQ